MKATVPFTIMNGLVTQVLLQGYGKPKTILILLTMVWSWRGTALNLFHPKDFIVFHCAWGRFIGVCRVCFSLSTERINRVERWNASRCQTWADVRQTVWLAVAVQHLNHVSFFFVFVFFFGSQLRCSFIHQHPMHVAETVREGYVLTICQIACHVQSADPPDSFFLKRARF